MASFTWRKGFDITLLCNELRKCRIHSHDGQIGLSGFFAENLRYIIFSAIKATDDARGSVLQSAVWKSFFSPELPADFNSDNLIKEIVRQYHEIIREHNRIFLVFFEITTRQFPVKRAVFDGGGRIIFAPSEKGRVVAKARKGRAAFMATHAEEYKIQDSPNHSSVALAYVTATSALDAHSAARDALDELRGLYNFILNRALSYTFITSGRPKALNHVLVCPLSTVHDLDGTIREGPAWYERDWEVPQLDSLSRQHTTVQSQFVKLYQYLHGNDALKSAARRALRMYSRALDNNHEVNAFLQLWTCLEFITHIKNADYDKLVSRAASLHENKPRVKQIGEHLRQRRNDIVHSAGDDQDAGRLIHHCRWLVEPLIEQYIVNPFKFQTQDELAMFLDLPHDIDLLRLRRRTIDNKLRHRGAGRRASFS